MLAAATASALSTMHQQGQIPLDQPPRCRVGNGVVKKLFIVSSPSIFGHGRDVDCTIAWAIVKEDSGVASCVSCDETSSVEIAGIPCCVVSRNLRLWPPVAGIGVCQIVKKRTGGIINHSVRRSDIDHGVSGGGKETKERGQLSIVLLKPLKQNKCSYDVVALSRIGGDCRNLILCVLLRSASGIANHHDVGATCGQGSIGNGDATAQVRI